MYALDAKAVERDAVIRLDQEACIVSRCRRESTSKLKNVRCVGAQRVSRAGLQEAGGSRPDDPYLLLHPRLSLILSSCQQHIAA